MIKALSSMAITLFAGLSMAADVNQNTFYPGGAYQTELTVRSSEQYDAGVVSINGDRKEMKLRLNMIDSEFADDYKFENIDTRISRNCNIIETSATLDRTPVDGPKITVVVLDRSQDRCRYRETPAITEVTVTYEIFDRINGGTAVTEHSFRGDKLTLIGGEEVPFDGYIYGAYYAGGELTLGLFYKAGANDQFKLNWGDCDVSYEILNRFNSEVKRCEVELVRIAGDSGDRRYQFKEVTIRPEVSATYLIELDGIEVLLH